MFYRRPESPTEFLLYESPVSSYESANEQHDFTTNGRVNNVHSRLGRYITSTCVAIGATIFLLLFTLCSGGNFISNISITVDAPSMSLVTSSDSNDNTNSYSNDDNINITQDTQQPTPTLDFAIIGFEKTGTTTLLKALSLHPEIIMPMKHSELSKRICTKRDSGRIELQNWLNSNYSNDQLGNSADIVDYATEHRQIMGSSSSSSTGVKKHGIKCSDLITKTLALENIATISNQTKLIIGLRHPVHWFQSLYNYRVRQHYELNWTKNKSIRIPSPQSLANGTIKQWRGVSTTMARFDISLKQLTKVSLSSDEMMDMISNMNDVMDSVDVRISPTPFKVFLYTIEQLEADNDDNANADGSSNSNNTTRRHLQFQKDLQSYLQLQSPIQLFTTQAIKENVNDNITLYNEYMDICHDQYTSLREVLVEKGRIASEWIREKFVKSNDVIVSDGEYFNEMLSRWSLDPCIGKGMVAGKK